MNFWWYFALFLLVPILVHLFDFRKAKRIYFSSVKYIASLNSRTKSKSRLKYFLILSNRILFFTTVLVLIWILLNQDRYQNFTVGSVAVYYDNSISSTLNEGNLAFENGLSLLTEKVNPIYYFDNRGKFLISKNVAFSRQGSFSLTGMDSDKLLHRMNESPASSFYLFSDFQSVNLPQLKESFQDSSNNYELFLTNELNSIRNVYVDNLYLRPNEEDISELSILVGFGVNNMTSGSIVVKLMQDKRQLSSVVKDITELDNVRFDISKELYGQYEIVIDGDDVAYDNTFHFSISEQSKTRIALIDPDGRRLLKEVYGNKELFDVTHQDFRNPDYGSLKNADLVVVSNLYAMPENFKEQLPGVNFIVFPSDSIDTESYESFLGLRLINDDKELEEINVDVRHPLFKGVFENNVEFNRQPREISLFRVEGEYESVIEYRGGTPFLLSKGEVYFFNASFKPSTSTFQSNAMFLPIMYQIAFASTGNIETPYYYPGDKMILSVEVSDVPIKVIGSDYEVIPDFNSLGSETVLELPQEIMPGKYFVMQNSDTLQHIALNIPGEESKMSAPDLKAIQEAFADKSYVSVSQIFEGNISQVFTDESQSSLWKYALILAMLLLLTETVLHRYLK